MPTTTYPLTSSQITVGMCDLTSIQFGGGRNFVNTYPGTQIIFACNGSATISIYGDNVTSVTIKVDGVTSSLAIANTSAFNDYVLTSVDGPHIISVTFIDNRPLDSGTTIKVTSAGIPSLTYAPGYGPSTALNIPLPYISISPTVKQGAAPVGNYPTAVAENGFRDQQIRFRAVASALGLFCYNNGARYLLTIDGIEQSAPITVPATAAFGWVTWSGLDSSAEHEYKIHYLGGVFNDGLNAPAIMTVGGSGLNKSPLCLPKLRSAIVKGDSITYPDFGGNPNGFTDTRSGYAHILSNMGMDVASYGVPGTPVSSVSPPAFSVEPEFICILWGTNDITGGTSQTTFTNTYQSLLTNTLATHPNAYIYALSILPRGDSFASGVPIYNGYIQTAVANVANSRVMYADISAGFIAATMTPDGLHPNKLGYTQVAANLAKLFRLPSSMFLTASLPDYSSIIGGLPIRLNRG